MNEELIHKIDKYLKKHLDKKRYIHTLGVAYTATSLAMIHDVNVERAYIAGLLHDSAKCMETVKKLRKCEKYNVSVSEFEKENPFLLHGKVGAILAEQKFDIDDQDIFNAITFHTTGRPKMSKLEMIIYIADYIEPNRRPIPRIDEIRKLAFVNLEDTMVAILENTLSYLKASGSAIDPMSKLTYKYYKEEVDKHE